MPRRDLTAGETAILKIIQHEYGFQNTVDEVFFTSADEAAIFVKALDGTSPMMANLSNLAAWRSDGTIANSSAHEPKLFSAFKRCIRSLTLCDYC